MVGTALLYGLSLFWIFGGHVPSVESLKWTESTVITLPFAVSRFWDMILVPALFYYWAAVSSTKWWDSLTDDQGGTTQLLPILFGLAIAATFIFGNHGAAEDPKNNMNEVFTLVQVLGCAVLLNWLLYLLLDVTLDKTIYTVCLIVSSAGIAIAFDQGSPYFIIFALVPGFISVVATGFYSGGHIAKAKLFFSDRLASFKKIFEKVEKEKTILDTALTLKVTPKTKERIKTTVDEIRGIEKEIARNRNLAEEYQPVINQLAIDYDNAKAMEARMAASSNPILRDSAPEYGTNAEEKKKEKETLLVSQMIHYGAVSHLEEERAKRYALLEGIENDAATFETYDVNVKKEVKSQKDVAELLKKEAAANQKK